MTTKAYFCFYQTDGNTFCTTKKYRTKTLGGLNEGAPVTRAKLNEVFGTKYAKWYDALRNLLAPEGGRQLIGVFDSSDSLPKKVHIDVDP